MKRIPLMSLATAAVFCVSPALADTGQVSGTDDAAVLQVLQASFSERNEAKLDRLEQSDMQKLCSRAERTGVALTDEEQEKIRSAALARISFPADGQYLGDWHAGEKVAQSGRGMQFSDKPGAARGGNCYACHQMSKAEISFGNMGPSLLHYGKLRGDAKEVLEYTWTRLQNPHAIEACSIMPRFGDAEILTEAQLKDVMALLFDPSSPVNDDSVDPKAK